MSSTTNPTPDQPTADHSQGLYKHAKRPDWGLAILAWDKGDKRGYQFEDGTLRVFRLGYYDLFDAIEAPPGEGASLVSELNRRLKEARDDGPTRDKRSPLKPVYPFSSQMEIFQKLFPEGFEGVAWQEAVRGDPNERRLKRHREPAIVMAGELLARDRMQAAMAAGRVAEVVEDAITVMTSTNLVSKKHAESLRGGHRDTTTIAEALFELLHGEGVYSTRFDGWVTALRKVCRAQPSWELATSIAGLYFPNEQVCVAGTAFKKQAGEIAPSLKYSTHAAAKPYANYMRVASSVKQRLEARGYKPVDFLDVHEFIRVTLIPSAIKHIAPRVDPDDEDQPIDE